MQLLIVHRHFWPSDLPYAQMLSEFALFARDQGHEVTVAAPCVSTDDETKRAQWGSKNNIKVISIVLPDGQGIGLIRKGIIYCQYLLWLRSTLSTLSPHVVWVGTTPPVLAAMLVRRKCKGEATRYIYHCQDIHPEASNAIGKLSLGPLSKWLRDIDNKNVINAWRVIVLSDDMKNLLVARGGRSGQIRVINNFVREELLHQAETSNIEESAMPDVVDKRQRWIFAGTMGHFQNLELLVDALLLVDHKLCPSVTFMGGGAVKPVLVEKVKAANCPHIRFLDAVSSQEAQRKMESYDVGLVSLAGGVIRCAYPSKVTNYLAAGLKIFAILESDSDLACFLTENTLGAVADMDNAEAVARGIELAVTGNMFAADRALCRNAAATYFNKQTVLSAYEGLLHDKVESS